MQSLDERDDELARKVIDNDMAIDRDENEVDELALQILATRQPVASDLRFITMSLKFVTDLERIGDLAAGIAKRALELNPPPAARPRARTSAPLASLVHKNLKAALDASSHKNADRRDLGDRRQTARSTRSTRASSPSCSRTSRPTPPP